MGTQPGSRRRVMFLPRDGIHALIQLLRARGYAVVGPVLRDGVISLGPIQGAEQLAHGTRDDQSPGHYRTMAGDPDLTFEYVVGADGPKRFLFPPNQKLWEFHVEGDGFVMDAGPPQVPRLAFLGIRPCELAAIKVQDRVFGVNDPRTMRCESETYYTDTRREAFMIVVNCIRPGGTCFCLSMGTGPQVKEDFDLAMTELRGGFVVEFGSQRAEELAPQLPLREPTSAELELAELKLKAACEHMGRELETQGLAETLEKAVEHPEWDEIAKRCLSCGNCTMVCPTCFCSTVDDTTGLVSNSRSTRTRQWESCFSHQFTYTTAGPVRHTVRGRYRQWMRHKLCTFWEQFNCTGCVGCGRCITWCPVGIDITAEAARIRATAQAPAPNPAARIQEVTL